MSEKTDPKPSIQFREFDRKKKERQGRQGRQGHRVELRGSHHHSMLKGIKRRGCLAAISRTRRQTAKAEA